MTDDPKGGLFAHPALDLPGVVAGIGLRASAGASDVFALLDTCLAAIAAGRPDVVGLATLEARAGHPALLEVARALGVPILSLPANRLPRDVPNPSQRVADLTGSPSIAEAAALVFGPLVVNRQRSTNVTCALSRYEPPGPASSSSASSAASTLATSSAGP